MKLYLEINHPVVCVLKPYAGRVVTVHSTIYTATCNIFSHQKEMKYWKTSYIDNAENSMNMIIVINNNNRHFIISTLLLVEKKINRWVHNKTARSSTRI